MKELPMLKRRCLLLMTVLCLTLGFLGAYAAESETSQNKPLILIEAASPDENGFFDVTVSAENLDFLVSEIALRYDANLVTPVDIASGEPTEAFGGFAETPSFDGVSRIGEKLDVGKGYFLFTLFANPGVKSDYVWDSMVHFGEKTELYRFRFRKIAEGDVVFAIASVYDGGVYDPFFPDGAVITSAKEKRAVSDVVIRTLGTDGKPLSESEQKTVYYYYSELYPKNYTKSQRLAGTVYLVKDDYAAAVNGALAAIDPDNRAVRPIEKDGVTLYPLRFVCESLGCTVAWDDAAGTALVTRQDGSVVTLRATDAQVESDAAEEGDTLCMENDRLLVSERFMNAACGARSYKTGNGTIFYTGIPEWTPEREAEKQALADMQYVLMPFFRMFLDSASNA